MKKIKISHKVIMTGTHGQDLDSQSSAELSKCHVSSSLPPPLDTSLSGIVKAGFPSVTLSLSVIPLTTQSLHTLQVWKEKNVCFQ